ncbi:MAG: group 1 truncated hemoglobin [Gallionella sp.]
MHHLKCHAHKPQLQTMKPTLFDAVGGLTALQKAHKIFYDKVYAHPWIGQYFIGHSQEAIENRQTSFMAEKMGGPIEYMGKDIEMAHEAMYITDELFDLRKKLLEESLREAGLEEVLRERWLKIDSAFMKKIVKGSLESFMDTRWLYKKHIIIPKP